jgi:PIN domain nuclease of toxin-antitoxin system
VTLLDAYALVAFLADERAAAEVAALLRADDTAIPSVNLAELIDVMLRVRRHAAEALDAALLPLLATTTSVLALGQREARLAGVLRAKHYDRRTSPLSLADCLLLASAVLNQAALATCDPPLAAAARSEGVKILPLPDSEGRRP